MSRASRLPKFFIFFKKTTSVAGTFKKDQVQKFCSRQKLEHPQVEISESEKVGQNPENFQWKVNVNRKSRKLWKSIFIDFALKKFRILGEISDFFGLEIFNLRML